MFCFVIYPGDGEACDHCPIVAQFLTMVTEPSNRGGFITRACSCTLGGLDWVVGGLKLLLLFFLFSIGFNVEQLTMWIMRLLSFCVEREGVRLD